MIESVYQMNKNHGGREEEHSTKYLHQIDGDTLVVPYVDKKETLLSFPQSIQVSVLQKMCESLG